MPGRAPRPILSSRCSICNPARLRKPASAACSRNARPPRSPRAASSPRTGRARRPLAPSASPSCPTPRTKKSSTRMPTRTRSPILPAAIGETLQTASSTSKRSRRPALAGSCSSAPARTSRCSTKRRCGFSRGRSPFPARDELFRAGSSAALPGLCSSYIMFLLHNLSTAASPPMTTTSRGLLALAILLAPAAQAGAESIVSTFAGNAQHTAVYEPAAQDLNAIRWSTAIDLNTSGAFAHFGGPLITPANTLVVPVKSALDDFRIDVFDAANGRAKYSLATDYVLPAHNWIPVVQPALATGSFGTRLYVPGAGGTIYSIDDPDSIDHGAPVRHVFYTTLANYLANAEAFDATVFVNTPITPDADGNVFFGFRVQGTAPAPLS